MFTKHSILALAAAAASVQEVAAGPFHRQYHHVVPRDVNWAATETVVVVAYETVTVYEDEVTEATQPAVVQEPVVATTTSSTTSSATTQQVQQQPATQPTTMSTKISTPVAELPEPSVEVTSQAVPTLLPSTSTTATSTTTTSAATSTSASSGKGKRGAAFNDASLVNNLVKMAKTEISWAYNWGDSESGLDSGIEYIPMLWGAKDEGSWAQNAKTGIANGASALLSFNEPDIASQAIMTPAAAAQAHIANMNPFASQARISAPAISSSQNAGQGLDWLSQFFTACAGQCKVDFCAIHWYGPGGDSGAQAFLQHVQDAHTGCQNKPLWITEFAAESGDVDTFYSTVFKALDSDEYSYVERYSPFFVAVGQMLQSSTTLTSWGDIFAGLSS